MDSNSKDLYKFIYYSDEFLNSCKNERVKNIMQQFIPLVRRLNQYAVTQCAPPPSPKKPIDATAIALKTLTTFLLTKPCISKDDNKYSLLHPCSITNKSFPVIITKTQLLECAAQMLKDNAQKKKLPQAPLVCASTLDKLLNQELVKQNVKAYVDEFNLLTKQIPSADISKTKFKIFHLLYLLDKKNPAIKKMAAEHPRFESLSNSLVNASKKKADTNAMIDQTIQHDFKRTELILNLNKIITKDSFNLFANDRAEIQTFLTKLNYNNFKCYIELPNNQRIKFLSTDKLEEVIQKIITALGIKPMTFATDTTSNLNPAAPTFIPTVIAKTPAEIGVMFAKSPCFNLSKNEYGGIFTPISEEKSDPEAGWKESEVARTRSPGA
jgi:predicted DNA-binding ArsR family transcriptional regulator